MPKISVLMPVYNAEKFLKKSIESILNQTVKDLELIIVNDGSTDRSKEIIDSFSDRRIKLYEQENSGEGSARNVAMKYSNGNYITFQDADDISIPIRLEKLLKCLENTTVGFVHSDMLLINEYEHPIGYWSSQNIQSYDISKFFIKIGTPFNNPSIMIRKDIISNYSYDSSLKVGTDTLMMFNVSRNFNSYHIPEPLYLYRRHSKNISNTSNREDVFLHIRKMLNTNIEFIDFIFPEFDYINEDRESKLVKKYTLIALYLSRRGMLADSMSWFEKAAKLINNKKSETFVNAIGNMILGNYLRAISLLELINDPDCIVLNYLGELYSLIGESNKAFDYFMKALKICPRYNEPLENLKALGASINYNIIDTTWKKFIKGVNNF